MGFSIKNFFGNKEEEEDLSKIEDEFYSVDKDDYIKDAEKSGSKMILLEPRAYSESQQIADHLKSRNGVVVNLKRVTSEQAKRIIDFLSGCIYAIGGEMQKIGVGIYLCTPKNFNVQGTISEDKDDSSNKESDDELEL